MEGNGKSKLRLAGDHARRLKNLGAIGKKRVTLMELPLKMIGWKRRPSGPSVWTSN
jgi:hypothetical protein